MTADNYVSSSCSGKSQAQEQSRDTCRGRAIWGKVPGSSFTLTCKPSFPVKSQARGVVIAPVRMSQQCITNQHHKSPVTRETVSCDHEPRPCAWQVSHPRTRQLHLTNDDEIIVKRKQSII